MSKAKAFSPRTKNKICNLIGRSKDPRVMAQEAHVSANSTNGNFCANGTAISVPTGWSGKGGVPPRASHVKRQDAR